MGNWWTDEVDEKMSGPRLQVKPGDPVECIDLATGAVVWTGKVRTRHPKNGKLSITKDSGQRVDATARGNLIGKAGWSIARRVRAVSPPPP